MKTFLAGGYYSLDLFSNKLKVIGLNTIMCSDLILEDFSSQVATQFTWLNAQLAAARSAGQKAWIIMHVPPGVYMGGTNDNTGQLSSAGMMWFEDYQNNFLNILSAYPGLVSVILAGHTHMDEYRILSPEYVLEITPGISPVFANDPAYKLFTFDNATFAPVDYQSIKYSLASAPSAFTSNYIFSEAYPLTSCSEASMIKLFPELAANSAIQASYRKFFYSGSASQNTITDLNWPAYWSCVGNVSELAFINGVNNYNQS
jgi:hypothetical protein